MTWDDLADEEAQLALAWTPRAPHQPTERLRRAMLVDAEDAAGMVALYRRMFERDRDDIHPALGGQLSHVVG